MGGADEKIAVLEAQVVTLEREIREIRAERNRVMWGLIVTLFGVIGSGVVYIWTHVR